LVRDLLTDYHTKIGGWNSLGDDADHVAWLAERKENVTDWPFWTDTSDTYGTPPSATVTNMDEVTDDILGRLEAPDRVGAWDRRDIVSGQVQSGKTANYTGLIAKALDSGYKLVVVLAGIHNSLRSQTQARIDAGILASTPATNCDSMRPPRAAGSVWAACMDRFSTSVRSRRHVTKVTSG